MWLQKVPIPGVGRGALCYMGYIGACSPRRYGVFFVFSFFAHELGYKGFGKQVAHPPNFCWSIRGSSPYCIYK